MRHLEDDHLEDYLLAKIPEGIELIVVEDHLFRCRECFARFQRTEAYFRVMEVDLGSRPKRTFRQVIRHLALEILESLRGAKQFRIS